MAARTGQRHAVVEPQLGGVGRACGIANTLGAVQVPAHWRDAMQALHDEAMQR